MKEQEGSPWAIITIEVLYSKDLTDRQKLLVAMIANKSNYKGYCWASNKHFAEAFGCTERSIQRDILDLEKKNFLIRTLHTGEDKTMTCRALTPAGLTTQMTRGVTPMTPRYDTNDIGGDDTGVIQIEKTLKTNNNSLRDASIEAGLKLRDLFNAEHSTKTRIVCDKTIRQLKRLIEAGYTIENVIEASKELKKEKWLAERGFKEFNIEYITRPEKFEKYFNKITASMPNRNMGANEYIDQYLKNLPKDEQGNS